MIVERIKLLGGNPIKKSNKKATIINVRFGKWVSFCLAR